MNAKMLKEDIKTGQVESIAITQNPNGDTFISVYMRKTYNRFTLTRVFPSAASALKFVEKLIQLKPLAGLLPEYQRTPQILITITRRNRNEKNQHDSQEESTSISEGEPSASSE